MVYRAMHQLNNIESEPLPVASDDGLYNHIHHGQHNTTTQQLPPPIYSTLAEGGAPADYSVITERERNAGYTMIGDIAKIPDVRSKEETIGDYSIIELCEDNHTHHGHTAPPPIYSTLAEGGAPADYSVITEIQDTSDGGMVYSAVVRKDGKKTTVKTTAQNGVLHDSQQQPAPDTSNEGLVYSAVVVKDGKKTTVKTMTTTQNEQTSSTSDTVQPAEGMVYSAVIRQDGKKTTVKTTFLNDSLDTTTTL